MPAASAQTIRLKADREAGEELAALLEAVGAPPVSGAWAPAGAEREAPAGTAPAATARVQEVPAELQRRRSDNWLAWNVGCVRPDPFGVLFERYWRPITAFCLSIVGTPDEAEDAAAEAMSRAYATLSLRRERPEFRPWIHAIARNVALDRVRRRNRGPRLVGADEALEVPLHETPGDVLGRREGIERLVADLQALSERQRAAIVMRELSGMSHEEIAAALKTTPARSQALVADARQTLAERRAGREIRCGEYRRAVDSRGRIPRGHRLAAHRAACPECRTYARPRLLNGVAFLPFIELFAGAGRRVADAAGSLLAGAGPAGAAKVATAVAVVAVAVPAAQQEEGAAPKAGIAGSGGAPVAATAVAGGGAAAAAPATAAGPGRTERRDANAERRRTRRAERGDRRRERRAAPRDATEAPAVAQPVAGDGEAGPQPEPGPAPRPRPAEQLQDALRQTVERVTEPVRRQTTELVENLRGALQPPQDTPAPPPIRLPGVEIDRDGVRVDLGGLVRGVVGEG